MNNHDSTECHARYQKRYMIFTIVLMILIYILSIFLLINSNSSRHLSLTKETKIINTPLAQIDASLALLYEAESRLAKIQKEIDIIRQQLHSLHYIKGECDEK